MFFLPLGVKRRSARAHFPLFSPCRMLSLVRRAFLAKHPKSEHFQQERFFALLSRVNHPAVFLTFAIPNQALALLTTPARVHFSKEGCKAGVPDVLCAYPSSGKSGLWIEFKKPGETPRENQQQFIDALVAAGYQVLVAFTAEEAFRVWCEYLGIRL